MKRELDQETWDHVLSYKRKDIDYFYNATEPIFIRKREVNDWDDVLLLAAFAYSWMPTIPELHTGGENFSETQATIVAGIQKLKSGDVTGLKDLLINMIQVFNNSVVGVSKMLHFAAPVVVPILDGRILDNWQQLFGENEKVALPSLYYSSPGQKTAERYSRVYMAYRDHLISWQKRIDTKPSLRDLEKALFNYQFPPIENK
jgi:hypothetical protein